MRTIMITLLALVMAYTTVSAQSADPLQDAVTRLDKAASVKDYEALEKTFSGIAVSQKTAWLPYYYAAFCNAKIGFLYQDDGERIEPYSKSGEEQAKQAISLLNADKQKKELAEVNTVLSMVYRTRVFINPMTYGRQYGSLSQKHLEQAKQLDPQNPRALYVEAWVKYYTPKLWGGDKQRAKQLAEESLAKLPGTAAGVEPHWGRKEDQELLAKIK
ncbi:MAG TPA: hypothetical protein VM802_21540 [Chitinophaga sp.]|uniref:hypothetical protein n=1 Tax=Chitinophaga sp. TaxID=1869181 RepID=UPI002B81BFA7|nr:hypothetical protein [Chitinophaga sp.]HVI47470.1 hypothetical protein [Chitinophaga sp.]